MSMFPGAQGFHISGGQFNVAGRDINNEADPLLLLWLAIGDVGASHNSGIRYPPPRCHPGTRQQIMGILHKWIYGPFPGEPVMWLYGPAGAGKSAIAQTVSEIGQEERYLVSSFFFSRGDSKRGVANYLCLCVAHGLATSIPELQNPIAEAIKKNPAILGATLAEQLQKLILEPCRTLERLDSHPWLIVIDGLDECKGSREQQHILTLLATVLPKQIRLRFLICSRPEPHIREAFDVDTFRPYLRRVALDETFYPCRDIATFLDSEFSRIRADPHNQHIPFPNPWPAPGVVYELAQKACGQFIYAATVIKFVDNEYSNPCVQLEEVLHPTIPRSPEMGSPFHDLDVLYQQILLSNPQRSKVRDIIWALVLAPKSQQDFTGTLPSSPKYFEAFLLLPEGDVISTLRGMHSILKIGGPKDGIRILHASFNDFLSDESRSGYFFLGSNQKQCSFLACKLLQVLEHYSRDFDKDEDCTRYHDPVQLHLYFDAWHTWGRFCSQSDLDGDVLNVLRNFDLSFVIGTRIRGTLLSLISYESLFGYNDCIEQFSSQTQRLLERLQPDPALYADIIQRFSDYRRGFTVKVSYPGVPGVTTSGILDIVTQALGFIFTNYAEYTEGFCQFYNLGKTPRRGNPVKYHFRVIPIGNSCRCTGTRDASRLWLPCSESASGDVYHIQLWAILTAPALGALSDPDNWCTDSQEHLAYYGTRTLCRLLDTCGSAPELLDLVPNIFPLLESSRDKERLVKWLRSFPPEYADRILPVIEQVQTIKCRYR